MKFAFRIIPWVILLAPFLILASFYNSINDEVLTYRSFGQNQIQNAPKSLFTVFRVPLIEVVCAAAIETMRRKTYEFNGEAFSSYYSMWSVLLFTVALKSLFQTFEFISTSAFSKPQLANIFFYTTFAVVIGGIILAAIKGRRIFANFRYESWKLKDYEKLGLVILFLIYLTLAFSPILIYR